MTSPNQSENTSTKTEAPLSEYRLHPRPTVPSEYLELKTAKDKHQWEIVANIEKNERMMKIINDFIETMWKLEVQRVSDREFLKSLPETPERAQHIESLESDCFFVVGVGCQLHKKTMTADPAPVDWND